MIIIERQKYPRLNSPGIKYLGGNNDEKNTKQLICIWR